jgi:L-iditol 2-dehydrogenase
VRALVKTAPGPGHVELRRDWPEPVAKPGWVVVAVDACGVCGTDLHIASDEHKNWPPVVLGHEYTGRIVDVGPLAEESPQRPPTQRPPTQGQPAPGWQVGDAVVCEQHTLACGRCFSCRTGAIHLCPDKRSPGWGIDGAFADLVALPARLLHRVPDGVSVRAAAVTEPAAICLTGLDRGGLRAGESVLVIGPGPIGLLSAMLASAQGAASVLLAGRPSSASRLAAARTLGLETATASGADLAGLVASRSAAGGADLVIETTGSAAGLAQAIGSARRGGRIVCLGLGDGTPVPVPLDDAMARSLTIHMSMSSEYTSWDRALALMAAGRLDAASITTVYPLEQYQRAFDDIAERSVIKALLAPRPLPEADRHG